MLKPRRITWIIISIILIAMLILAFKIRNSFIRDTDIYSFINDNSIIYTSDKYEEDITKSFVKNKNIQNLKALEDISPIIVRVKVDDSAPRDLYEGTTLTKVIVEEVYKGSLEKEYIYLFEPFDVFEGENSNRFIYSIDGYNILKNDSEYVLFLKSMKDSTYTSERNIYLPTTTSLSKYKVENKDVSTVDKYKLENNSIKYRDVEDLDIITSDENTMNKYNEIKDEVIKKYVD